MSRFCGRVAVAVAVGACAMIDMSYPNSGLGVDKTCYLVVCSWEETGFWHSKAHE